MKVCGVCGERLVLSVNGDQWVHISGAAWWTHDKRVESTPYQMRLTEYRAWE